jgi:hypothetical protein
MPWFKRRQQPNFIKKHAKCQTEFKGNGYLRTTPNEAGTEGKTALTLVLPRTPVNMLFLGIPIRRIQAAPTFWDSLKGCA